MVGKWWSNLNLRYRHYKQMRRFHVVIKRLETALQRCGDPIPCLVISYNNGVYVANMVLQLSRFGLTPIIIDNSSSDLASLAVLDRLEQAGDALVVRSEENFGHLVGFKAPLYASLPEIFAYTDPDLEFNAKLPANFLSVLSDLTARYNVFKAGFALDLPADEPTVDIPLKLSREKPFPFRKQFSVREWEAQFWSKPLQHESLEVFAADVDTTFAVYRKTNYRGDFFDAVRVGGAFGALHLPWFPRLDLFNSISRSQYLKGNKSNTWAKTD